MYAITLNVFLNEVVVSLFPLKRYMHGVHKILFRESKASLRAHEGENKCTQGMVWRKYTQGNYFVMLINLHLATEPFMSYKCVL